jgi:hypothetical protein
MPHFGAAHARVAPTQKPAAAPIRAATISAAAGPSSQAMQLRHTGLGRAMIQRKLAVGRSDDPLEHEADQVAEQVMRMPAPEISAGAAPPQISRKCAACEEEDKLQMKSAGPAAADLAEAPASVHEVLRSPGRPLDPATRAYFEPRFGRDFSHIRIHTDPQAAASARAVNALAYTAGNHIVFGAGAEALSNSGRPLIAHELAHTAQQSSELRRMTLGQGDAAAQLEKEQPGQFTDQDLATMRRLRSVPDAERSRVLAAIERLRTIAYGKDYAACQKAFGETCPGGTPSSLREAFEKAVLWRSPSGERPGAGATTPCGTRYIIYTDLGYVGGEASLTFDLLHELGHICGIACRSAAPNLEPPPHYLADKLALSCLGPLERDENAQFPITAGLSTEGFALILSYGWLLHEWRAGRLSLHLNADLNVLGLLYGLQGKASEIAGPILSLRGRPFSGEHFGGLSFHGGLGGEFGRFRIRQPVTSDPPDIRTNAALVFEAGGRIEWWTKRVVVDEAERVAPHGIDLSYRLIQPVSPEAKRIHEALFSYIFYF